MEFNNFLLLMVCPFERRVEIKKKEKMYSGKRNKEKDEREKKIREKKYILIFDRFNPLF